MQLTLNLPTRLAYSADNFIAHQGVAGVEERTLALCQADTFALIWVEGEARYGKTHLSVKLAEALIKSGKVPTLIEGLELESYLAGRSALAMDNEVLIIDDADHYLRQVAPGASGPLVQLIESFRVFRGTLVFFSAAAPLQLPCDAHITSRLRSGLSWSIGRPAEKELGVLLQALAHQRGFHLDKRQIDYLVRRLGADIPAMEKYLNRLRLQSEFLGQPLNFRKVAAAIDQLEP